MNKAPRPSVAAEKPGLSRRAIMRAAKATGAVLLIGSTVSGCFDLGQPRPDDAAPYPSNTPTSTASAKPGQVPFVSPGKNGVGIRHDFIKPPKQVKNVEHTGTDVCLSTPDSPSLVSSVDVSVADVTGTASAAMLDVRCADFPGQDFGMPKDGDTTGKHFYAFEEPTTEATAVDLGAPTRSAYLSNYMGVCSVNGELFEGTDGTYSRTWLAVFTANSPQAHADGFVPYAETGYVAGTQGSPIAPCNRR